MELLKITPSSTKNVTAACPLRLSKDTSPDSKGAWNPIGMARLRDPFVNQLRELHFRQGVVGKDSFTIPGDLTAEETVWFDHYVSTYVELFADKPFRTHLGLTDMPTPLPKRGVELTGWVDLVGTGDMKELRQFDFGGRIHPGDPLEVMGVAFACLRLASWFGDEEFKVSWIGLPDAHLVERVLDVGELTRVVVPQFDEALRDIREVVSHPKGIPGLACISCRHYASCGALDQGARPMKRHSELLPEVISLTPTSYDSWFRCPRYYLNRHVLSLPESDPSIIHTRKGLLVHKVLEQIHRDGPCAGLSVEALEAYSLLPDEAAMVLRHVTKCPQGAKPIGHEMESARFHRFPEPFFLGAARFDAIWLHDGILDVRDYKTGRAPAFRVQDDPKARLMAWILKPLAAEHGADLQIRYEMLSPDNELDPEPFNPVAEDLLAIEEELQATVDEIMSEDFYGVAEPTVCNWCSYRSICPDAVENLQV